MALNFKLCASEPDARQTEKGENMRIKSLLFAAVLVLGMVTPSLASPINEPPPSGALLDLAGQTVPNSVTWYNTPEFYATSANTTITFAFRDDSGTLEFATPTVEGYNGSTWSGNLFINSSFTGGVYTSNGNPYTPDDWTYANQYGASNGGYIDSGYWYDGATQAYDTISQTIPTTDGELYTAGFYLDQYDTTATTFSDLSTNGDTTGLTGNGVDVLVYETSAVPEPCTLLLIFPWLIGMAALTRVYREIGQF